MSFSSPLFFLGIGNPDTTGIGGSLFQDEDIFFDANVYPAQMFGGALVQDTDTFSGGELVIDLARILGSLAGDNVTFLRSLISSDIVAQSNHIVNLPEGSNVIGRVVVVCVSADGTPTFTFPAGWTELTDSQSTLVSLGVAYREIDGTEGFDGSGDTISVSTSNAEPTTHITYLIENADSTAIEISSFVAGNSASPDPGTVSPSSGYDNYLNIAVVAHDVGSTSVTGYPSGYIDNKQISAGGTGGCGIGGAVLIQVASSEDPSAFTLDASRNWVAMTISVRSQEVAHEPVFNQGTMGFGEKAISGSVFEETDTFNTGKVYFGTRLSTAIANKTETTIVADPFTIAEARNWITCTIAIRGS